MRKRGNLAMEGIGAFVFLLMFVGVGALVLMMLHTFNNEFQKIAEVDVVTKERTESYTANTTLILDGAFVLYLAILWIAALVSAYFLDSSPIFFVIFFLIGIISFFIVLPMANVFIAMEDSPLGTYLAMMPMSMFLITNMGKFMTAFLVTTGFALYAKYNSMQGGD